jgi:hypothetical protein
MAGSMSRAGDQMLETETRGTVESPGSDGGLPVVVAHPPSGFRYDDTLSVPKMDLHDDRVIQFKLPQYDDMLLLDEVMGISKMGTGRRPRV